MYSLVLVNKMSLLGVPSHPWFGSWTSKKKLSSEPSLHATFVQTPTRISNSRYSFSFLSSFLFPDFQLPIFRIISPIFLTREVLPGNYSIVNTSHVRLTWFLLAPTQLSAAHLVWWLLRMLCQQRKIIPGLKYFLCEFASLWVCESLKNVCGSGVAKPVVNCTFQCSYPHSQGLNMLLWALNKVLLMEVLSHMLFADCAHKVEDISLIVWQDSCQRVWLQPSSLINFDDAHSLKSMQ